MWRSIQDGFYGLFFHRSTQFHGSSCGSCLTFFESLLNINTTCEVGPVGIIKSLKMATLNSSREASAAARSNIFYRLIKASPDFIFIGTE